MSRIRVEFDSSTRGSRLTWYAESVYLAKDGILELRTGNTLILLGPDDHDGPVRMTAVNG